MTQKGKAIASLNATKHGILSQKPPLLATEDLETFQGMIQGLIDEYQPTTPTEQLLIQQVAMGWLRLHRLWGAEAATANLTILKQQKEQRYPYFSGPTNFFGDLLFEHGHSFQEILTAELNAVKCVIADLNLDLSRLPTQARKAKQWITQVQESLDNLSINWPSQTHDKFKKTALWTQYCEVKKDLDNEDGLGNRKQPISPDQIQPKLKDLIQEAKQQLSNLQTQERELNAHEKAIVDADITSQGLSQSNLFSRYEQHITKQLTEALDRLSTYQEQRKNKDPMGSFGKS